MSEKIDKNQKISKFPAIIVSILLLLSFFHWPYGYYIFLRWAVTFVALYYAYHLYTKAKQTGFRLWSLIVVAILFNPVVPIYLYSKITWNIIDIIVAVFFISLIIKLKNKIL